MANAEDQWVVVFRKAVAEEEAQLGRGEGIGCTSASAYRFTSNTPGRRASLVPWARSHTWETPAMVRRYAHLATDHLAAYASKVGIVVANDNRPNAPAIAANDTGHKLGTVGKGRVALDVEQRLSPRKQGNLLVPAEGLEPPTP
jgi:hypothetical protein